MYRFNTVSFRVTNAFFCSNGQADAIHCMETQEAFRWTKQFCKGITKLEEPYILISKLTTKL